ncbi:DUF4097 family beta strand repeat-containing protein [Streptomyces flavofungini]|uniref:DUF4097 family beta strand repeat-containing protein n=1 Tax=Streptomyces flavofungini TaxID=68200 RepID=UPI0025AFF898|nr:DUF4097 family beta strand repeat-containing protein [Streptomyces flavofungini]WJV45022.1 DUF4097 family beta strand repeat-containing protein [Streptomyces flavofungini]
MPTFDTPEPISVALQLNAGLLRLTAGARTETVVEVSPSNGLSQSDRSAAEQTRVEYGQGRLLIRTPRRRSLFGSGGSVDVSVELPAGSRVSGDATMADIYSEGDLGECEFKTGHGRIQLERAGRLQLNSGFGDVTVGSVTGETDIRVASGDIRIGRVDGALTLKNSSGDTDIEEVTGRLRATVNRGDISIGRVYDDVTARSVTGDIRVGEVTRGRVELRAAAGELEVGVRKGSAAWLDVHTKVGHVRNSLGASEAPELPEEAVEIHAVTSRGDIVIRRA